MKANIVLGVGIILGVIGASLLVALGLLYVKPFRDVQTMKRAQCMTLGARMTDDIVHCHCTNDGSSSCLSQYPCMKLMVNFTTEFDDVISNSTLYDSYETFVLQRDEVQCSFHKCSRSPRQNLDAVNQFGERYGSAGTTYPCHYEPSDLSYAILEVVTMTTVIHCMLWPSLALVVGMTILCVYLHDPKQAEFHHFNSLERPWQRTQNRYENIVNPQQQTNAVNAQSQTRLQIEAASGHSTLENG